MTQQPSIDHPARVVAWIADLTARFPRRAPASPDELGLQQSLAERYTAQGLEVSWHRFSFGTHLYANLLLHFGLAVVATGVGLAQPLVGGLLHLLVATSYFLDSTHRAFVLRRLLPWRPSQNLIARLPAAGEPLLRVVIPCHADTAYTGLIFSPRMAEGGAKGPITKPLALVTYLLFALALLELGAAATGRMLPWWLALPLTVPALLAALGNLDVVLRNRIVPGAADNLSGIAAMTILAERLTARRDPRVEYNFVATGCEEASLGGATMLARDRQAAWPRESTLILVLDGCSNGDLRYLEEGEMFITPVAPELVGCIEAVAASDARFAAMKKLPVPVGGSDAAVFAGRGYTAVALSRVDARTSVPREYHLPTDTADRLSGDEIVVSSDFAERLIERWVASRIGAPDAMVGAGSGA